MDCFCRLFFVLLKGTALAVPKVFSLQWGFSP